MTFQLEGARRRNVRHKYRKRWANNDPPSMEVYVMGLKEKMTNWAKGIRQVCGGPRAGPALAPAGIGSSALAPAGAGSSAPAPAGAGSSARATWLFWLAMPPAHVAQEVMRCLGDYYFCRNEQCRFFAPSTCWLWEIDLANDPEPANPMFFKSDFCCRHRIARWERVVCVSLELAPLH
jgi:hypothetical protein